MNAPGRISFSAALAAALSSAADVAQAGVEQFSELLAGARRFVQRFWDRPTKRRRGISAMTASRERGRRRECKPRLGRARGPGTINARADGLYLARTGQWAAAADMLEQQYPELAARYRRYASDTELRDIPHELAYVTINRPFTARFVP